MKQPKSQGTLRSAPIITTRSRRDQLPGVIKWDKKPKEKGIVTKRKPRNGKVAYVPHLLNSEEVIRRVERTNTKLEEQPRSPQMSPIDSDTSEPKPTTLPSISKILGDDLWRENASFSRRSDPFYPGYSSFANAAANALPTSFTPINTSPEPDVSQTNIPPTTPLLRFSLNLGPKQLGVSADGRKSKPKKRPEFSLLRDNSKESTLSPESESDVPKRSEGDLLPEVKSKSKIKIEGTHTFRSTQNKKLRKELPKRYKRIKRWTQEEDRLIIHYKENLKKSWKDIESLLDGKHSWQAIQMRYLRCHKTRNNTWKDEDVEKLLLRIQEDFDNRNKRILIEMGPSFSAQRIAIKIEQLSAMSDNPLLRLYATDDKEEDEDEEGVYDDEIETGDNQEDELEEIYDDLENQCTGMVKEEIK